MSHLATTWAWRQSVSNPIRKLILLHVAQAANPDNDNETWHSISTISTACSCSRGAVHRHMKDLCDLGYLTLIESGKSQHSTNRYRLNVGEVSIQDGPCETHRQSSPDELSGANQRSSGEQQRSSGEQQRSSGERQRSSGVHEPVNKPVSEPVRRTGKGSPQAAKGDIVDLPDWLPRDLWRDYLQARKSKKHAMARPSLNVCVKSIRDTVEATGLSVQDVMEPMIAAGWICTKPSRYADEPPRGARPGAPADISPKELARQAARQREEEAARLGQHEPAPLAIGAES